MEQENQIEKKMIYAGRIVSLELQTFQLGKHKKTAEIVRHPGAVVILPIDPNGNLLLVQQWRRATGEILLELPAGTLEKNEKPLATATRELQEETGFAAKKITPMGGFFTAPGFCDEYLHLFLAEELYPSPLPADEDEMIDLVPVSVESAKQMIVQNKIKDAKTVAGILRYLCLRA